MKGGLALTGARRSTKSARGPPKSRKQLSKSKQTGHYRRVMPVYPLRPLWVLPRPPPRTLLFHCTFPWAGCRDGVDGWTTAKRSCRALLRVCSPRPNRGWLGRIHTHTHCSLSLPATCSGAQPSLTRATAEPRPSVLSCFVGNADGTIGLVDDNSYTPLAKSGSPNSAPSTSSPPPLPPLCRSNSMLPRP